MKHFIASICVMAIMFAVLGAWVGDDLASTAFEVALNGGGGSPLDYVAVILLNILIIPFVFVLDFPRPAHAVFFALNGVFWTCLCWGVWKMLYGIAHKEEPG